MNTKTIYHQFATLVLGVCIMSAFSSCGDSRKMNSIRTKKTINELTIDGSYEVQFSALNSSVGGFTNAKGQIHVIADKITVRVEVKDSPAMTIHIQKIYNSDECPTDQDDVNNDGFIDPTEVSQVLNEVLVPLDGNLNTSEAGAGQYPVSNLLGNYNYFSEGILSELMEELFHNGVATSFEIEGKVIVIQGIPEDVYLPGSIRSFGADTDRASLAIACGKIVRKELEESETTDSEEEGDLSF